MAKVVLVTRRVLFSLKCTRNRLAAGLCPDPLGELERFPKPSSRIRGRGPREGRGWDGRWVGEGKKGREKGKRRGEEGGKGREG